MSRSRAGPVARVDDALREPMMTRIHDAQRRPRALFICGSLNQTSQLCAVAQEMAEFQANFTPFYGGFWADLGRRSRLFDRTILGAPMRARCLAYLRDAELSIDLEGRRGPYDLVVGCTDLLLPPNIRGRPLVIVQEGMTDPETIYSRAVARLRWMPAWTVGTTLTATRGRYDRFCCASPGYRDHFVARGAPAEKLRVTGIPNFDDCESHRQNPWPARGFVLVCTSDLRETLRRDDRLAFLRHVRQVASGRPVHFKFHPNEDRARATREVRAIFPHATICTHEKTEELIANCDVLVTQFSSVAYVGLALGKEVHSHYDIAELRRLLPIQNGGRSAANIADVCRALLGMPTAARAPSRQVQTWPS